jgi:hypothetical protein
MGMNRRRGTATVFRSRLSVSSIGRVVRCPGLSRRHGVAAAERSWPSRGGDRRLAMVRRCPQFGVTAGRLYVLGLDACGR